MTTFFNQLVTVQPQTKKNRSLDNLDIIATEVRRPAAELI